MQKFNGEFFMAYLSVYPRNSASFIDIFDSFSDRDVKSSLSLKDAGISHLFIAAAIAPGIWAS